MPIPPQPAPPGMATFVSATFELTWNAVIDHFAAVGVPIATLEHESGLIETEQVPVGAAEAVRNADCGSPSQLSGVKETPRAYLATSVIYNVVVQDDGSSSSVLAAASWVTQDPRTPFPCETKGVWEAEMQEAVKLVAEANR